MAVRDLFLVQFDETAQVPFAGGEGRCVVAVRGQRGGERVGADEGEAGTLTGQERRGVCGVAGGEQGDAEHERHASRQQQHPPA